MFKKKNITLRIIALICFVIIPIFIIIKTPILKQFYCSKTDNLCILRIYNTFDQKPSTSKNIKISEISNIQKGKCKELFGLYTNPCISIESKNNSYTLDYSLSDEDADKSISDFKNFLKNSKVKTYKLIADKKSEEINLMITSWGVIILLGILISAGFIEDKKKNNNINNLHNSFQNDKILK